MTQRPRTAGGRAGGQARPRYCAVSQAGWRRSVALRLSALW